MTRKKTTTRKKTARKGLVLDWKYCESGQHFHIASVAGFAFAAYVNLNDGHIYYAEHGDPRFNGTRCKDWAEVDALAVTVLKKAKAELEALGI